MKDMYKPFLLLLASVMFSSCQSRNHKMDGIVWKAGVFDDMKIKKVISGVAITDVSLRSAALLASGPLRFDCIEENDKNLFFGRDAENLSDYIKKATHTERWYPEMNYLLWISYTDGTGLVFAGYWDGDSAMPSFYIRDRNLEIRSSRDMENFWTKYLAEEYYPDRFFENEDRVHWKTGIFEDLNKTVSSLSISYGPLPLELTTSDLFVGEHARRLVDMLRNAQITQTPFTPNDLLWAEFPDKTGVVYSFLFRKEDGKCYIRDSNGESRVSKELGDFWIDYKKINMNRTKTDLIPDFPPSN